MAYTLAELEPDIHKSIANAAELLRQIGRTIAAESTDFHHEPSRRIMTTHDFTALPDLASRAFGGSVSAANDELFAQRENLIHPTPVLRPDGIRSQGKGVRRMETRRRRDDGHDYAIVRLGTPGIIHGIIVDTAYFKGNYPPFVSVEAASIEDIPLSRKS